MATYHLLKNSFKLFLLLLLLLLLWLFFLSSLFNTKETKRPKPKQRQTHLFKGYPVKLIDDRGKTVSITAPPQRVVVGGTPLYTEILLDLKAKDRLVGITDSPNNPPASKHIASIGRSWPLNIERVLTLRPDLVLCALGSARAKLEKDANITVFTGGRRGGSIASLYDLYRLIQNIDRILYGNTTRSNRLIKQYKQQLRQLQAQIKNQKTVSTAIIYMGKARSSTFYFVGGKQSSASDLLQMAKGRNVYENQKSGLSSIETLLAKDPEVILTDPKQKPNIMTHPILTKLQAVRNKRVIGIQASHYTSTRLVRVMKQLIRALHPKKK